MKVYNYIYVSQAETSLSNDDLVNILNSAHEFNKENGITGMLLYSKNTFMQLLEGDRKDIYNLMDTRIGADSRHSGIYVVKEKPVDQRYFKDWTMGFSNLDELDCTTLPAFTPFFEKGFTSELVSSDLEIVHKLLLSFRKN